MTSVPIVANDTSGIIVPDGVSLRGASRDLTILRFRGTPTAGGAMARASSNRETTTGWVQVAATGTVPSGTATVRVVLRINDATVGESHYVDQVSLATGTSTHWRAPGTTSRSSERDGSNLLPTSTGPNYAWASRRPRTQRSSPTRTSAGAGVRSCSGR